MGKAEQEEQKIMTLNDIAKNPLLQTREIAADTDEPTRAYIQSCINSFFIGNYGEIPEQDVEANSRELEAGEGHILARYKQAHALKDDIYINAHFSKSSSGIDYNNTLIMYCHEY